MRNILKYLVVLLFGIVGIACSNDDNKTDEISLKELIVKIDKQTIEEGELINFSAFDIDNNQVTGVNFYVNNVKVTGNSHQFNKKGVYNIIAMKSGYKTSLPRTVLVGNEIVDRLELVPSATVVDEGDDVTFKAFINGKEVTDFYIELISQGILMGNTWSGREGTYRFYAFRAGCLNSEEISITVNKKAIKENQYFTIHGETYNIDQAILVVHAIEGTEKAPIPVIYQDKDGRKYQFFELVVANSMNKAVASYFFGVYVSKDERKVIIPSEAKPTDIFSLGGNGVLEGSKIVIKFTAESISNVVLDWKPTISKQTVESPMVRLELGLQNKTMNINYLGAYESMRYRYLKN